MSQIILFRAESKFYMILAFFRGIARFGTSNFEILNIFAIFGPKNSKISNFDLQIRYVPLKKAENI